jgi:hypothetical protein
LGGLEGVRQSKHMCDTQITRLAPSHKSGMATPELRSKRKVSILIPSGQVAGYPDRPFLRLFSFPPVKCRVAPAVRPRSFPSTFFHSNVYRSPRYSTLYCIHCATEIITQQTKTCTSTYKRCI